MEWMSGAVGQEQGREAPLTFRHSSPRTGKGFLSISYFGRPRGCCFAGVFQCSTW